MPATTLIATQQFSRLIGLSLAAALAIFRFKAGMIPTSAACCAAGIALDLAGLIGR